MEDSDGWRHLTRRWLLIMTRQRWVDFFRGEGTSEERVLARSELLMSFQKREASSGRTTERWRRLLLLKH